VAERSLGAREGNKRLNDASGLAEEDELVLAFLLDEAD
jgi:hypothetical protein